MAATILAALGQIELHLSVRHRSEAEARARLSAAAAQVTALLGADVFSVDGERLEEVVGELLASRGLTVAAAESCTGGLMTSRLTDVPGSSRYVRHARRGLRERRQDVGAAAWRPALLEAHGAVSEPVARAMAEGMRAVAGADIGVGITGIAGPDGGTPAKPVGTVAVAVAEPAASTRSRMFRFHRRAGAGEVPGLAGRAGHGAARAAGAPFGPGLGSRYTGDTPVDRRPASS